MFILFFIFSDLCLTYGPRLLGALETEPVTELLTQGRRSRINRTKALATWATKEIRKLKTATQQASW